MRELTIPSPPDTKVFRESWKAYEEGYRFVVNQGGSRSGKTYSILQMLIWLCFNPETTISVSVVSIAYPHLRRGAIRDFVEIMETTGQYNPDNHRKTESAYYFPSGSYIEFFSVDQAPKVRGPGRDILFINEANLLSIDTFEQLNIRTTKAVFMDYNPADEFSWIYDRVIPQKECKFIQTTYLDNPFLPTIQKKQIESLKDIDPDFWRVYGLGERGTNSHTIYPKFELYSDADPYMDYCYGLDFGFNHPSALCRVGKTDDSLYFKQEIYRSHIATPDLINEVKAIVGNKEVYCDSARPEIINDMINAGINAFPTPKFPGSVKDGIDFMRSHRLFIHQESVDCQKEMRSYKWKQTPSGQIVDEPVKAFDDLMDAGRYGAISFKSNFMEPQFEVYG
jgi:phage terminase large subunit